MAYLLESFQLYGADRVYYEKPTRYSVFLSCKITYALCGKTHLLLFYFTLEIYVYIDFTRDCNKKNFSFYSFLSETN